MIAHSSASPKSLPLLIFKSLFLNPLLALPDASVSEGALYRQFAKLRSSVSPANHSYRSGYLYGNLGADLHQGLAFLNRYAQNTAPRKAARIMSRKSAIVKNSLGGRA